MHIRSVGRALPPHRYAQAELTAAFRRHLCPDNPRIGKRLEAFHRAAGVEWRHLALPIEAYPDLRDFGRKNDAFTEVGLALAEVAIRDGLARAGLEPRDVDALYVVSVTGIAVPTLDARLVERLGLRPDVKRNPLVGLGCVAGAAGVARLHDYLLAWPEQVAVLVSVELCSLTLQHDDLSIPNLIGSGLFGDGAAAVVGVGDAHPTAGPDSPRVVATRSRLYPDSQDAMGWQVSASGFQLVLSAKVPGLVREHLREDVDAFLGDQGLARRDIVAWILHSGGPKVLVEAQRALELKEDALEASWRSLRRIGNLSSASVLFVLAEALDERRIPPGSDVMMAAMGPGFCAELVRIRW
jgi:alkylresorcinol/alkylpyrone synthase